MKHPWNILAVMAIATTLTIGCQKKEETKTGSDIEEAGQQIGDLGASVDESSGSSGGGFTLIQQNKKTFDRLAPESLWDKLSMDTAHAAVCRDVDFGACTNSKKLRTFGDCTVFTWTLAGTVELTWAGSGAGSCTMPGNGDSVSRNPDFTITGRRGATLTVQKTATYGQTITRGASAGTYTFTNDGIRRVFTAGTTTLFDFTTQTTSGITVSGAARAGRTLTGGGLKITNNTSSQSCTISPTNVTWASTCNCPTSGSWSGTCTDGKTFSIDINGCTTGNLTVGSDTSTVTFDRCYEI